MFLIVAIAAMPSLLGGRWLYHAWQLHQILLAAQAQQKLPKNVDVRIGLRTWTYVHQVNLHAPLPLEREIRKDVCADVSEMIGRGASYNYEYIDTSGTLVGRVEVNSCP